jgi:hypothetical protein
MILLLAWVFVLGAAIGSFLNVVVYRLPAGKSIAWPGSYCPGCSHPIRWYDNLPILGWVLLGGRCPLSASGSGYGGDVCGGSVARTPTVWRERISFGAAMYAASCGADSH